jgi:hypothetical protein
MAQIHPAVRAIMEPTIDQMTQITLRNKMYPQVGKHNEPEAEKQIKRRCVHYIKDTNGEIYMPIEKVGEHEYICKACGRKVNLAFNQESVDTIMKTIEIIDGLVMLAPQMKLMAEPLQSLISIKELLPLVADLQAQFNDFIKKDDSSNSATASLTGDYKTPERFSSITGYTG